MRHAQQFLMEFFERNLFERIVVYIFLSAFIVKVVFEFILGQWSYLQAQNIQWCFYTLLAIEYLVSWRKVLNIRVTFNPMSTLAFIFFVMIAHGLFVGIISHNQPFVILNDTVPLLMIALNILRMQSAYEYKPIDFDFLLKACTILGAGACFFGLSALLIGRPSQPSLGNGSIYLPLLLAGIFTIKPFPKWILLTGLIMIALTLEDMNRTTMLFFAVVIGSRIALSLIKNPVRGIFLTGFAVMAIAVVALVIPQDSKTYVRVKDLGKIDLTRRTGSIGERQAEWDAINQKLERGGPAVEMLGLGFGGVYEVARTHEYLTNYGHAHYSWAWFNLRFGRSGYLYLVIFVAALAYNGFTNLRRKDASSMLLALMCLNGLLYCLTYVNGVFMLSGLHFFYRGKTEDDTPSIETGSANR